MRNKKPDTQIFGTTAIEDIVIPVKCRDGVPKILRALQELYKREDYREEVLALLEKKILGGKKETGRPGMGIWEIFVLAQVRFGDNLDYDKLHYLANYDKLMRGIMGVENEAGFTQIEYHYDTMVDNVSLLDDEFLHELNDIIVRMGHEVFKKKEADLLSLKSDSYVCESNVHFPTDYNLLWDSARKCLDIIKWFIENTKLPGWRKHYYWHRRIKSLYRQVGQASRGGGKNKEIRLQKVVKEYLVFAIDLLLKIQRTDFPTFSSFCRKKYQELLYYKGMLEKHIDLLERRVLKGESIPHEEKVFSIFETWTEWINKGKSRPSVELGKKILLTSDQFNLIPDWQIMEGMADAESLIPLANRVLKNHEVKSWSFDKGFWSKENYEYLSSQIDLVVLPKKGKKNQAECDHELNVKFRQIRKKHSAIESNINELESKGPGRCPDKGYKHFKRYIGLGVIGYNLHRIGEKLRQIELEKIQKNTSRRVA